MVRDGYIYGLSLLSVAGVVAWATQTWVWSLAPILLGVFFLWFFRDRQRISIFLNVFDVHVNRSPIAGEVTSVRYQKGKFLNAMNQECTESNEQNIVTVRGEGMEVVFKQIAGLIARRIVFNFREGDRVERGQRVGLIKFGSRTDIILPAEADICVRTGQRVKGGASIIAEMPESELAVGVGVPRRTAQASAELETSEGEI